MARPLFNQIAIVGLGLIGGSLGMALKKGRVAHRVVGVARRSLTLRQAKARGAIDAGTQLLKAIEESDLIVLAAPPQAVLSTAQMIINKSKRPLIITDVASTKQEIVEGVEDQIRRKNSPVTFVGGHPMAGSDCSGIQAARGDLFKNAVCILTPTRETSRSSLVKVRALWRAVGSRIEEVSPEKHDELVAQISQVPHMAAVGLVEATSSGALKVAGTGFSDTTRIAQANPKLWTEISQTNAKQIVRSMDRLIEELKFIRNAIAHDPKGSLLRKLRCAQKKRRALRSIR